MEKLEWSSLEYEEKERSADWFWALGIIVVTSTLAAIIYGNYFFAALLLVSGFLLGHFATKKPDEIFYEINQKGIKIGNQLYPFENIKSFWVQIEPKPILFVHTERIFMPMISIPIEDAWAEDIHALMTAKNIPEQEMKEHVSEKIMDSLGF